MAKKTDRRTHEKWLLELTSIPTAAGREQRVIDWIERWVRKRPSLRLRRDAAGNLLITLRKRGRGGPAPIFITAHLDHPAFVVRRQTDSRTVELDFRGGVHAPYFESATIELFDENDVAHRARVTSLDADATPFKRVVARLSRPATLAAGDVGRWRFSGTVPRVTDDILHAHACDDLAGVAAALAALDRLRKKRSARHVGVLFTRAEEVGFVGTLEVCRLGSVSKRARLICLENSRSFPESPIGAGPILRVGDRLSVFAPELTNRIGAVLEAHAKRDPTFRWQRKLMPGGACEATAFSVYGWSSTCICLPLGNYHNMRDIDGVLAGKRPARVGPEFISVSDFHGMVDALEVCGTKLDGADVPPLTRRFDRLLRDRAFVLRDPSA